jgi:uncharacterized membrane protein
MPPGEPDPLWQAGSPESDWPSDAAGERPSSRPAAEEVGADDERDPLLRQAELIISNVLRGGVVLSAATIVIGVLIFYARYFAAGEHGINVSNFPHTLADVAHGLTHGDPLAIIVFGLLLLLATPVVRVAVSIVAFALERDWRFVAITALVFFILIVSFLLGRGGA